MNRNSSKTVIARLAAAAFSVLIIAPASQAKDKNHTDVDFGVHSDNRGNFGLDLNILSGHRRPEPRPAPCPVVERVWVDPVWRLESARIWVEPVWEKACDRAWCPPVTRQASTKVWIEPQFEVRETVSWDHGRKVVSRDRVQIDPGHYEERKSTVVITEGHWVTTDKWVLKCDGHWEGKDNWVLVCDGHYEDCPVAVHEVREVREVNIRTDFRDR